jgi:hypothetical protein
MNCTEFRRSLDAERLSDVDLSAHARTCIRCEGELRAAMEVERLLGIVVPADVTAGFNDAVMREIHAPHYLLQVFAEPIVPVSLALATIVAWQYRTLVMLVAGVANDLTATIDRMGSVALVVTPLIALISWRIFRAFEHLAD